VLVIGRGACYREGEGQREARGGWRRLGLGRRRGLLQEDRGLLQEEEGRPTDRQPQSARPTKHRSYAPPLSRTAPLATIQIESEFPNILPIKESLIKFVFEPNAKKVRGGQGTRGGRAEGRGALLGQMPARRRTPRWRAFAPKRSGAPLQSPRAQRANRGLPLFPFHPGRRRR
jgi:hypothetical protein